eukprot:2932154-Karenia_brevis.AAC.1
MFNIQHGPLLLEIQESFRTAGLLWRPDAPPCPAPVMQFRNTENLSRSDVTFADDTAFYTGVPLASGVVQT